MKKYIVLLLVMLLMLSSLTGCGSKEETTVNQGESVTIKIANWYAPDHPQNTSLEKFKEIVESKSNGQMKVEIFPNNQLGAEETFIDSVKQGTVEMGVPGMMMSRDIPTIAIAEMPFLFRDWNHVRSVLTGPLGEEITAGLVEKAGVRNLAWTVNGFRQISSSKPINKFEDLEGLRLRVPNVPYYLEMAKGFSANPIAMPFSELFTALEQKVVDGQDNPYPTVKASSIYEVQPYMVESRHIFSANLWIINEKFYQSLSDSQRTILQEAVKEAAELNWDLSIKKDDEDKAFLVNKGVKVVNPDEEFKQKLVNSQNEVYEFFYKTYPGTEELAEKIRATK